MERKDTDRASKQVVIIGGGVAGLTAGIYARKQGLACTIVEQLPNAGGNLTGWQREGHTIDNCIHWLVGSKAGTAYRKIWEETGALPEHDSGEGSGLVQTESLFCAKQGGEEISFFRDIEATRSAMHALSPEDKREIDRFLDAVSAMQEDGFAAALRKGRALLRYGQKNLYELATRFRHPLLRSAMTDYIGGEFSALALIAAYSAYAAGNGDIPKGGSRAMAERMAERFRALGGTLKLAASAERILIRDGAVYGVRLADGSELAADAVLAACDPSVTFGRLAREIAPPRKLAYRRAHPESFPVFSSVHAAFSADFEAAKAAIGGTKIVDIRPMTVAQGRVFRLAVREYTHDPSLAPEGKTVVQTLLFQRQSECRYWTALRQSDPEGYKQAKAELLSQTTERIKEAFPALDGSLSPLDCWTPATYARYFGEADGAYLSFAWTERVFPTKIPSRVPGCRGLYLATQWQHLPGGLPNAASAGIAAVEACLAEMGQKQKKHSLFPEVEAHNGKKATATE